jgi:hypothetical protein
LTDPTSGINSILPFANNLRSRSTLQGDRGSLILDVNLPLLSQGREYLRREPRSWAIYISKIRDKSKNMFIIGSNLAMKKSGRYFVTATYLAELGS